MRVILLHNVPGVGSAGEVKDVSPGHARNFLIPRGAAKIATADAVIELETEKKTAARRAERALRETEKMAARLQTTAVEIRAKAGEGGKLFGSVTRAMIADAIRAQGLAVTKEQVRLAGPLKDLGDYKVTIDLPHGLEAEIEVSVIASPHAPA